MRLVRVTWVDIHSYDEPWMDLKEAQSMKPVEMDTVGWIAEESEEHIVIFSTQSTEGDSVGSINAIPKGVIKNVVSLHHVTLDSSMQPNEGR